MNKEPLNNKFAKKSVKKKNKSIKTNKDESYIKLKKKSHIKSDDGNEFEIYENSDDGDSDNSGLQKEIDDFLKTNFTSSKTKSKKQKAINKNQKDNIKTCKKRKNSDDPIEDLQNSLKIKKLEKTKKKINEVNKSKIDTGRQSDVQSNSLEKFDAHELKAVLHSDEQLMSSQQNIKFKKKTKKPYDVITKYVNSNKNKIQDHKTNEQPILSDRKNKNLKKSSRSKIAFQSNIQLDPKEKFDILELKAILNSEQGTLSTQDKKFKNKTKTLSNNVISKEDNMTTPQESNTKIEKSGAIIADKQDALNGKGKQDIVPSKQTDKDLFREKLLKQLQSASFRILNEQMYTSTGSDAYKRFHEDPDTFKIYHEGYSNQVENWPVNPLKFIASWLRKKPKTLVVADFGCGDATLSKTIKQKVFSIDLVALSPGVIECDMAHTPLKSKSVDVVVFCLSLMGTNLKEFIVEANRVLVERGVLKIAEVESRFGDVKEFLKVMTKLGFNCIRKNQQQNYFWMFDFLKVKDVTLKPNTPEIHLAPCIYKKR